MFKIIIGVIVTAIVALVAFAGVEAAQNHILTPPATSLVGTEEGSVKATVTGEVNRVGTYVLPVGSTLKDLLEQAGKANANADSKAYDETYVLEDGMSFYIAPLYDNSDICAVDPIKKACLNSAAPAELKERVPAFTETLANAIVEYRTTNGPFRRLEELEDVKGIGPATFEKCKNLVTLRE